MQQTSLENLISEAKRQSQICNACRYCEGFCNVFPAMHQMNLLHDHDMMKLAHMCHNCRGCYYSCQYAEPHEFAVNIPRTFAELRQNSWSHYTPFATLSQWIMKSSFSLIIIIFFILVFFLGLIVVAPPKDDIVNFYDIISHKALISIFMPLFIIPYIFLLIGLMRFWRDIHKGKSFTLMALMRACKNAITMKNLNGGHGQGCYFEANEQYSHSRKYAHHLIAYGFLLCFLSTFSATILHYVFNSPAPYPFFSLPKLFGVPGGLMMVIGCIWMCILKYKAPKDLGHKTHFYGEVAFILLLGSIALTGLGLYFLNDFITLIKPLLIIHLVLVACLFIITPFSKMVHIFYRIIAMM